MFYRLKRILKNKLQNSRFKVAYIYTYLLLFKFKEKERKAIKKGDCLYVIRPRTDCIEGLMSLFLNVLKELKYARNKNYNVYVDMKNFKTQYTSNDENAWEYFFLQPDKIIAADFKKENIALSGFSLQKLRYPEKLFTDAIFLDKELLIASKNFIQKNIFFSDKINLLINCYMQDIPIDNCLGVYMRGTDYSVLKPIGEHRQPSIEMVINKVNEFISKYSLEKIFLVTEDFEIYSKFKSIYGNNVYTIKNDIFIKNYAGTKFLSQTNYLDNDRKWQGMQYLAKIVLLGKCNYFISSITNGSIAAYLFHKNDFIAEHIFDLGKYGDGTIKED